VALLLAALEPPLVCWAVLLLAAETPALLDAAPLLCVEPADDVEAAVPLVSELPLATPVVPEEEFPPPCVEVALEESAPGVPFDASGPEEHALQAVAPITANIKVQDERAR
jgi:hypothetical protein